MQEVSIMYYFVGEPNFVQLVGFCNLPYQVLTDYYSLGNLTEALLNKDKATIQPTRRIIMGFLQQISGALALMHRSGFAR